MKINQLSKEPKLIKVVLDSEEVVKEFGEPVEFYTYDRQPLETFLKLAGTDQTNYAAIVDVLRTLILDEHGKQVIDGKNMIPTKILVGAMQELTKLLGK